MRIEAPFHEGELEIQRRIGDVEAGKRNAAAIADTILKGALRFIAQQPMAVVGSVDPDQNVWASLLFGEPGFVEAPDDRTVILDLQRMAHNPRDAFWKNIESDPRIGMLLIELASRRRIRINGPITRESDDRFRIAVEEAYPNCPKYIQRRAITGASPAPGPAAGEPQHGERLTAVQEALITASDTFFVASANPRGGVDASHRGGNPGFVTVRDDRTLRVPDYVGNSMYNTLGNFVLHPRAGLVFPDFAGQRVLQLIGRPELQWDVDDPDNQTGGTQRYWDFQIERWVESTLPPGIHWEFLDYSPFNPNK